MTPAACFGCFRARATSSAVSFEVMASGFSHSTCLPPSIAAFAISKCSLFGVPMCTDSTALSSSSSFSERYAFGAPIASANFVDSASETPRTPTTSHPARRSASACTPPMKPAPTTATPIRAMRSSCGGPIITRGPP